MSGPLTTSEAHSDEEKMANWKTETSFDSDLSSPIARAKKSPIERDHLALDDDWTPSARVGTSPSARLSSNHASPAARVSSSVSPRVRDHSSPHVSPPPSLGLAAVHSRHHSYESPGHQRHSYRALNGSGSEVSPLAALRGGLFDDETVPGEEGGTEDARHRQHLNGYNYQHAEYGGRSYENGGKALASHGPYSHLQGYPDAGLRSMEDLDRDREHTSPVKNTIRFPIMSKKSPSKKVPAVSPSGKTSYEDEAHTALPPSWTASETRYRPASNEPQADKPADSQGNRHRAQTKHTYYDTSPSEKRDDSAVESPSRVRDPSPFNGEQRQGWIKAPGRPGEGTVLKCQHCPFTKPVGTGCMVAIRKHEACHFNKSTYKCHVCTFSTININTFRQHQQMHVDHGDCSLESLEISGPRKRKARKTIPSASLPKPRRPPISNEIKELIKRDIYNQHQGSLGNPALPTMSPHQMALLDKYKRASLMSLMYNDCGSPELSQSDSSKRPKLDNGESLAKYYESEQGGNNADLAERQRYWRRAELGYSQEKYYADNSNFMDMFKTPHQMTRKPRYSGYDSEAAGSAYMSGDESRASSYGRQSGDEAYDMSSRYTPSPYRDSPAPYIMPTASPEMYPMDSYRDDARYRRPRSEEYDHPHGDEYASRMNLHRSSPFLYNAPGDMSSARSSPSVRSSPPNMVYDMRTVTPVPSISPASSYDDQAALDLTPRHHLPASYAEAEMYYSNEGCLDLSVGKAPSTSDASMDDTSEMDGAIDLSAKPSHSLSEFECESKHPPVDSEKKRRLVSHIDDVINRNNQLVSQSAENTARTQPKGHHIPHIPPEVSPTCLVSRDGSTSSPEAISRFQNRHENLNEMPVLEKVSDAPDHHADKTPETVDGKEVLYIGDESDKLYEKNGFMNVVYKCKFCPFSSGGVLSSKAVVSKHQKCHMTQRRYACDLCNYNTDCSKNMRAHLALHPVGSAKILMNGMPAVLRMRKKRFSASLVGTSEGDEHHNDVHHDDIDSFEESSPSHADSGEHDSPFMDRVTNGFMNDSTLPSGNSGTLLGDSLGSETAEAPLPFSEIADSPTGSSNERIITKKRTKNGQSQGAILREKYKAPPGEKFVLKCPLCPQRTTTKSPAAAYNMKRHELCHSVAGRYTCSLCSYSSQYLEHLKRHQNLHSVYDGCTPPIKQGKKFIDIAKRKKKAIALLGGENNVTIDRSKRDKSDILKIKFKFGAKAVTADVEEARPEVAEAPVSSPPEPSATSPPPLLSIPLPIYEDITPVPTPPRSPLKEPLVPQELPPDMLRDELSSLSTAVDTPDDLIAPASTADAEGSDSSNATIEMDAASLEPKQTEAEDTTLADVPAPEEKAADPAPSSGDTAEIGVKTKESEEDTDSSQGGNRKGVKGRNQGEKYRIKCRYCPFTTAGNAAAKLTMERHEGAHFMRGSYTCDICSFSSFQFWKMKKHKRLHGVDMDGKAVAVSSELSAADMESMDTIETLQNNEKLKEAIAASKKSKASTEDANSKSAVKDHSNTDSSVKEQKSSEESKGSADTDADKEMTKGVSDSESSARVVGELKQAEDNSNESSIKTESVNSETAVVKPKGMIFRPLRPVEQAQDEDLKGRKKFRFDCQHCPFKVNSQSNASRHHLVLHEQCHFKKSPFSCEQCSYSGKSLCSIRKHAIVHNPDYTAGQHCRTLHQKQSARLRKAAKALAEAAAAAADAEGSLPAEVSTDNLMDDVQNWVNKTGSSSPAASVKDEPLKDEPLPSSEAAVPSAEDAEPISVEEEQGVADVVAEKDATQTPPSEDSPVAESGENVKSPLTSETLPPDSAAEEKSAVASTKSNEPPEVSSSEGAATTPAEIGEFRVLAASSTTSVVEDAAKMRKSLISAPAVDENIETDVTSVDETKPAVTEPIKSASPTAEIGTVDGEGKPPPAVQGASVDLAKSSTDIAAVTLTSANKRKAVLAARNKATADAKIKEKTMLSAATKRKAPQNEVSADITPKRTVNKGKSVAGPVTKKGARKWVSKKKQPMLKTLIKKESAQNISAKDDANLNIATGTHKCADCSFLAETNDLLEKHVAKEHTKTPADIDDIYSFPDTPTMCDSPVSPGGYLHKHSTSSKGKVDTDADRDKETGSMFTGGATSDASSPTGTSTLTKGPLKGTARASLSKRRVPKNPSVRMKKGMGGTANTPNLLPHHVPTSAVAGAVPAKKSPKSKPIQTAVQIGISALVAAGQSSVSDDAAAGGKKKPDKKMLEIPAELWWDPNQSLFQCQWCDFTSTRVHYFKIHLYCHQRKRAKHRCARCGYGATRPAFLAEHHRQHHKSLINVTNNDQPKDLYEAVKERLKEKGIDERVIDDLTGPKPNQAFSPLLLKEREKAPSPPPEPATKTKIIRGMTPTKKGSLKSKRKWESAVPKQPAVVPEEGPKFLCCHCPFTTTSAEVESSHRAKHTKRNRHCCPYCTYATRTRVYLEKHVKLHFTEPLQKSALENLPLNLDAFKEKKVKRTTKQQTGSSACRYCDVKVELTRLTSHEEKHLIGCGYLRFTNGASSSVS